MLELQFKCVRCGKRWTLSIDESDAKRYYQIEPEQPHRQGYCCCVPQQPRNEHTNGMMNAVCNDCND